MTSKLLIEEQRHLVPNDMNSWIFKNRQLAKPFTGILSRYFLNRRIRKSIINLRKENTSLIIGETHCHSNYSDGLYSVQNILYRAALLGLDYVVITDHFLPGKYFIESIVESLQEQMLYIKKWEHPFKPVKIYPAFEVSALEGHLLLIFDEQFLTPKKIYDISLQFSEFNSKFISMLDWIPRIASLGGISIVAHPNQSRTYPFGASTKWVKENLIGLVDGIEDISTGHGFQENFSKDLGLASIGSSDDHFNLLMGTAVTAYDSNTHGDLISAVKSKKTKAICIDNSLQYILTVARQMI